MKSCLSSFLFNYVHANSVSIVYFVQKYSGDLMKNSIIV
ncbi:hypothetical protein BD31_I1700 [Candidatus Nitrosopumilus salaria BD31]|uniref:Uncharacterized protein n=1 Tax=Candidatus Nitrosopumilus salarius BD31 TaxID=859350 RepID=I3D389_9ARCH|nr:hypothetical protein BD31_I1700 [Candidatus Nitrosopumilus salaria BD31]